ncbi:deoxynucleoside triphosphate triphosphohydrolase SAMHD1 [Fundulus heteroclitus]|uniref:deoxynucleoside triphosphate triphosphohydrolase SAMHD1 n=1 Tax=Fundulus heteroclitus TaxID=8078 RepID=UPI00165B37EB|nr:deoxynucleoside triphosphate triphosphohydrolase SAMHD1 [Fundulus heteroclitus]
MAAIGDYKVFNDPIHGLVKLHPLLVKIIGTPQFQRLRNIKQLGGTSYVYPGATHSRFEHSIGVAYLAGELVQALNNQPGLNITPAEKLCVQIAGLCHDLGHGPFSHLYEEMFERNEWTHEMASVDMFDHLVEENNLMDNMTNAGLNLALDLDFIRELCLVKLILTILPPPQWLLNGRPEDRSFLYEIVANKRNGIDVDKWDYFARDCHYLGMKNSFDYQRLILSARVCAWDNRNEICFRDKEVFNLYDMFYTRFSLHKRAYKHKVAKAIGLMIIHAFRIANEHIQIRGSVNDDGEVQIFNLNTARDDMEAYTKLTDDVVELIRNPQNANAALTGAKELLDRIHSRNLYKCLGEIVGAREFPCENLLPSVSGAAAREAEFHGASDRFLAEMSIFSPHSSRSEAEKSRRHHSSLLRSDMLSTLPLCTALLC